MGRKDQIHLGSHAKLYEADKKKEQAMLKTRVDNETAIQRRDPGAITVEEIERQVWEFDLLSLQFDEKTMNMNDCWKVAFHSPLSNDRENEE